jgi:hypothetical protein
MHNPSGIVSTRQDGAIAYYIVCGTCAQRGDGRVLTINGVEHVGVIYGPVSELLADSLMEAHRTATARPDESFA